MTDNNDDKTLNAPAKKTLTLKPGGMNQGTVRQDMGRGRTNAVVVETRKRRPCVPKTRSRFSLSWRQLRRRSRQRLPLRHRVRRPHSNAFNSRATNSSVRVLPIRSSAPARPHRSSVSLTVRAATFCTTCPQARWKPAAVR